MSEFVSFRRMVTPIIIQILFWFGSAIAIIFALVMMTRGGSEAFIGFIFLFLGPLAVRIYCELLILFFRMNETLSDIRQELRKNSVGSRMTGIR